MDEVVIETVEATASEIELLSDILVQLNTCTSLLGIVVATLILLCGALIVCLVWRVVCRNVLIF